MEYFNNTSNFPLYGVRVYEGSVLYFRFSLTSCPWVKGRQDKTSDRKHPSESNDKTFQNNHFLQVHLG